MSLLVYRLTGEATVRRHQRGLPVPADAAARRVGGRRSPTPTTSARWRSSPRAGWPRRRSLLGVLDLAGLVTIPVVYVLSLLLGVVAAFDNPARRGLVTELVPTPDIPNATSLNTAVMTGSRIFGPAMAAALVATIGTAWCFIVNGLSFFAIIFSLVAIRRERDVHDAAAARRAANRSVSRCTSSPDDGTSPSSTRCSSSSRWWRSIRPSSCPSSPTNGGGARQPSASCSP